MSPSEIETPRLETGDLVRQLETCTLSSLTHEDHVRVAWHYLLEGSLARVLGELPSRLSSFAASKGAPGKYHETVTWAFVVLIHERMEIGPREPWEAFAEANPDLFRKDVLKGFYPKEVLESDFARRVFVLPPAFSGA